MSHTMSSLRVMLLANFFTLLSLALVSLSACSASMSVTIGSSHYSPINWAAAIMFRLRILLVFCKSCSSITGTCSVSLEWIILSFSKGLPAKEESCQLERRENTKEHQGTTTTINVSYYTCCLLYTSDAADE